MFDILCLCCAPISRRGIGIAGPGAPECLPIQQFRLPVCQQANRIRPRDRLGPVRYDDPCDRQMRDRIGPK